MEEMLTVYVPEAVALELAAGQLLRPDKINPEAHTWAKLVAVMASDIETLRSSG
jgi:hypothetical protein